MHERGLDQPLKVLIGGDGIEAWHKLTTARHRKLLDDKKMIDENEITKVKLNVAHGTVNVV